MKILPGYVVKLKLKTKKRTFISIIILIYLWMNNMNYTTVE